MLNRITLAITVVLFCISAPSYSSDLESRTEGDISTTTPMTPVEQGIKQCSAALKKHVLKTNLALGKCMVGVTDKLIEPSAINKLAYRDAKNQFLLLMIHQDKGQVSNEEAQLLASQIWGRFDDAENAAKQAMVAREEAERQQQAAANEQAAQQRDNAFYGQLLKAVAQPFNDQRQWVDQQNQQNRAIQCNTSGSTTTCRQY